jgi:streptogramin lyase
LVAALAAVVIACVPGLFLVAAAGGETEGTAALVPKGAGTIVIKPKSDGSGGFTLELQFTLGQ